MPGRPSFGDLSVGVGFVTLLAAADAPSTADAAALGQVAHLLADEPPVGPQPLLGLLVNTGLLKRLGQVAVVLLCLADVHHGDVLGRQRLGDVLGHRNGAAGVGAIGPAVSGAALAHTADRRRDVGFVTPFVATPEAGTGPGTADAGAGGALASA